jgi:hypothetical protein
MKIEVLKAGSTLSGAADERFTLAALTLSQDPNPEVAKPSGASTRTAKEEL